MSCLCCLLRHGETLWNREKRIQGQSESPLSPSGVEQADAWGTALRPWHFTRLICSTLGRARQTAEICNKKLMLPLVEDARLCEQHWGDWEGGRVRDLRAEDGEALAAEENKGWDFRPPGGESRRELLQRGLQALQDLAARHPQERLLLVSHNGLLRALALHLQGSDYMPGTRDPVMRGRLVCIQVQDTGMTLLDPARALEAPL